MAKWVECYGYNELLLLFVFPTLRYRDSYDELSKSFKNYADDEEINESFSDGLKNLTNAVTILGDYMDLNVHRMELKVADDFWANLCCCYLI